MTGPAGACTARPPGIRPGAGASARLLPAGATIRPSGLTGHLAQHGTRPFCGGDARRRQELIDEIERAGLTGRGGAAFPTGVKLRALGAARRTPAVIANGVEGEPASGKDKMLLTCAPHLVLDGVVCAAELIGADEAVVVVHQAVRDIVSRAAAERRLAGCDPVPLRVIAAADGFTAGEASAVVHWVKRGVPTPSGRPPRLGGPGRGPRPWLVQNVETMAHLALIIRRGAAWFRSAGTPAEPGSMLVTLHGAVRRPGVYEIAIGTPVRGLLKLAGGAAEPLGALLLGGYFGTWAEAAASLPLAFSSAGLAPVGATPGAGVVVALPRAACGLAETARVTRYLAASSAGQCGPCVFGLDAIAGQLERLAAGGPGDLARVQRWLGQVAGRGACRHPDGTAQMVASALRVFSPEIDRHTRGWCSGTAASGVLPIAHLASS